MSEGRASSLYRRYGPAIYARCRGMLGDAASAEDATQETFFRVFKNLDGAPPNDKRAKRWLYRIATNVCLDLLRARAHGPPSPEMLESAQDKNVEERLGDLELARELVARTPAKLRSAAWLHYVDDLDAEEVGVMLGVSGRTVRNWLTAFLERARKLVGREPP